MGLGDFEKASTNALKFHFPDVEIKGCWFHFRKAIFKRVVKLGLQQNYRQTEYFDFINRFGALAFIPEDRLDEAIKIIERLKPNDPKCDQLLKYFKSTWLKSTF